MKKLSKILMILFILALAISAFAFFAFAQTPEVAAEIYSNAECTALVKSYASVNEALTSAEAGQYVIIKANTESFAPESGVADGVFVKADDGVTFTLSDDSALTLGEADANGFASTTCASFTITANGTTTKYYVDENGGTTEIVSALVANNGNQYDSYVKLFTNVYETTTAQNKITSASSGTSADPIEIYIDLNGYDLVFTETTNGYRIFCPQTTAAKNYIRYNVYSSREGGVFDCGKARIIDYTYKPKGIYVTLGEVTVNGKTHDGDNLTVSTGSFNYSSATNNVITFNIKGGTYYTSVYTFWARGACAINIEDAKIIATHKNGFFGAVTTQTTAKYTVNAKNSTFISTQDIANVAIGTSSTATFDNCKINGSFSDDATTNASMSFINGTLISTPSDIKSNTLISFGDYVVLDANGTKDHKYYTYTTDTDSGPYTHTATEQTTPITYNYAAINQSDIPASIKTNISTNNGFLINFYFAENSGMAIVDGANLNGQTIVGGVAYNVYTTTAISPASVEDITVKYSFKLDKDTDIDVSYVTEASVSLLDYFDLALTNAINSNNQLEKSLIINAANYCNKVYKYATGAEYEAYTDIVANADEGMIVTDFGDVVRDVTEGQTAIEEAAIVVADGNIPMFAFKVKGEQVDVYATYAGLAGKSDPILCSAVEATDLNGNTATYYVIPDMKIYDMKAPITLSLDAEGNNVILEYNLAAYIASDAGQKVEVDDALYSFADASYNYKTNQIVHNFGEWVVTKEPTESECGERRRECKDCGYCEIEEIPSLHDHTEWPAIILEGVAATCTEDGLTEGKKCSKCGEIFVAQETVFALGHDEITHEAKAPTCTEIGWDAYVTCSRCDYTTYAEKAALGHSDSPDDLDNLCDYGCGVTIGEFYVTYEMFGAVGDGVTDDFAAMKAAHDYANENGYKVLGNPTATYYIHETRINGTVSQIIIKTDTDWQGAKIIIDDTDVASNDGTKRHSKHVFSIESDYSTISASSSIVESLNAMATEGKLGPDTTKLDVSFEYPAMLIIYNSNRKCYIRYGSNATDGDDQQEIVLVDKDGNIDPQTVLLLDYENVTSVDIIRTDVASITVENANFVTLISQVDAKWVNDEGTTKKLGYILRGMEITRSNTVIDGVNFAIENEYTVEEQKAGLEVSSYRGFYTVTSACNVTIQNAQMAARRYYGVHGTYTISAGTSCYLKYKNCIQTNYYKEDGNISLDNTSGLSIDEYWGIGGSSYCKNIEWDGCMLTRFDAHAGLYNGVIRNSTVTRIYLIGGGTMLVEDTEIISEGSLVTLRDDYGATWKGEIILRNVTVSQSPSKSISTLYMISATWTNHYFGYDCHLPSVEVDDLTLASGFNPTLYFMKSTISGVSTANMPYVHTPYLSDGTENLNPYYPPEYIKVTGNVNGYEFYIYEYDMFENTEITGFTVK